MFTVLCGLGIVGLLALVIHVNVEYSRERAAMTPAEREAFDAEERREMAIW